MYEHGLLFGGGAESLLVLSQLLEQGISPVLLSVCGEGWPGSDPTVNGGKLRHDEFVAASLGLKLIRAETSLYKLLGELFEGIDVPKCGKGIFFPNALGFCPLVSTACLPVFAGLGIRYLWHGSEKEHEGYLPGYCLSGGFMRELAKGLQPFVAYCPVLLDTPKLEVVRQLTSRRPDLARMQFSCFWAVEGTWCYRCEKCYRCYALVRACGFDPSLIDFDSGVLEKEWPEVRWKVAQTIMHSSYHQSVYQSLLDESFKVRDHHLSGQLSGVFRAVQVLKARRFFRSMLPESVAKIFRSMVGR